MSWRFELITKPMGGVTEGPIWDGESLLFTHIPASRIMRYDLKSGEVSVWRSGTNRTNGLAHDVAGRLFGCCSGGRSIAGCGKRARRTDMVDGASCSATISVTT